MLFKTTKKVLIFLDNLLPLSGLLAVFDAVICHLKISIFTNLLTYFVFIFSISYFFYGYFQAQKNARFYERHFFVFLSYSNSSSIGFPTRLSGTSRPKFFAMVAPMSPNDVLSSSKRPVLIDLEYMRRGIFSRV